MNQGRYNYQNAEDPPTVLAEPLSATEDDHVGNDTHSLQHNGERHEESDRAPHGAEISVVAMAVFALREALTGIGEGGAAAVEAVGVVVGRLEKAKNVSSLLDRVDGKSSLAFSLW